MKVKYFASLQEKTGIREEELLPPPETLAQLKEILLQKYPYLKEILPKIRFAVNLEFVSNSVSLNADDEIALIPPVSGG